MKYDDDDIQSSALVSTAMNICHAPKLSFGRFNIIPIKINITAQSTQPSKTEKFRPKSTQPNTRGYTQRMDKIQSSKCSGGSEWIYLGGYGDHAPEMPKVFY